MRTTTASRPDERARAHMVFAYQVMSNSLLLRLQQEEMVDSSVTLELTDDILLQIFAMRGVRQWWEQEGRWFPDYFQQHVARLLERIDADEIVFAPPVASHPTGS